MSIDDRLFDEYVRICLEHPGIEGRETIVQLVAIGAAESGLDNLAEGDNSQNGTPVGSFIKVGGEVLIDPATGAGIDTFYSLGLGWLQHDSGWLRADEIVNGVAWSIEAIRGSKAFSLQLLLDRPGFVRFRGRGRTYIDFTRWAVWPAKSDEFVAQAEAAYDRAVSP